MEPTAELQGCSQYPGIWALPSGFNAKVFLPGAVAQSQLGAVLALITKGKVSDGSKIVCSSGHISKRFIARSFASMKIEGGV
jgi:hypothetical protein